MRTYATAGDYYDFTGGDQPMQVDPENPGEEIPVAEKDLNASLRRASIQIEGYTRLARFDVDEDGYPTDPDVTQAFTDATCAQVAWWDETGDITGADAVAGVTKILSVSLGSTAGRGNQRTPADARVSAEAVTILRNAGLITSTVAHT